MHIRPKISALFHNSLFLKLCCVFFTHPVCVTAVWLTARSISGVGSVGIRLPEQVGLAALLREIPSNQINANDLCKAANAHRTYLTHTRTHTLLKNVNDWVHTLTQQYVHMQTCMHMHAHAHMHF